MKIDVAIIGAGVVGLAIAARLAACQRELYVFERHPTFGRETSDRNSEVIHAGLYYAAGSRKGQLCTRGRELLYGLDPSVVFHCQLGKMIVAVSEAEISLLEKIEKTAVGNGVTALRWLQPREIKEMEPEVCAAAALFSPQTGIISAHQLMKYFLAQAAARGGGVTPVLYDSEIVGLDRYADGYALTVSKGGTKEQLQARIVINAAGLGAARIAELAGIDSAQAGYQLYYCKGEYFRVSSRHRARLRHLVYPVPETAGLGIHVTLDSEGEIKLGPSIKYLDENQIDYTVDPSHAEAFYQSARRYLPWLEQDDLQPDQAGIRPKLFGPGMEERDFVIQEESARGLPGLVNLIGIESPGLTAAPAIGEYVAKLVDEII